MVKSRISLQNVIYKENPSIDLEDKSKELIQYNIPLFEYPNNTIALGSKCTEYEKKGIIYHSCYLISKHKGYKIGVFEFPCNRYESYLEPDNPEEIMCSKLLPHLLLFNDAREKVQQSIQELNAGKTLGTMEPYKQAKLALPHAEVTTIHKEDLIPDIPLAEMSHENHSLGIKGIRFLSKANLIECISKVIHKHLKQAEIQTKTYLYGILADHITVSMFDILKTMYIILHERLDAYKVQHKEIKHQIQEHKKQIKHMQHQDVEFQELMNLLNTLKQQSQHLSISQKYVQKLLAEKEYMQYMDTVDQFKDFIKSEEYICEPWTIEIMERLMNVKIILLSKDMPQWLVCSRQSPFPHNMSLFNPMYYIVLEFTENDYRIVEANGTSLLTFQTLPLKIKDLIINRCLEQSEGVYANIPLFVKYKQFKLTKEQQESIVDESLQLDLTKDKILIGEALKKFVYPGTICSERMDFDNLIDSPLIRDKQWREKLADSYAKADARFKLGDKEWASVNHYVTAQQLKQMEPSKYDKLSITSGSTLSKKPIPYMQLNNDDRYSAEFAKFSQNPFLKELLINTGDADLYMYIPSKPSIKMGSLEKVRQVLK